MGPGFTFRGTLPKYLTLPVFLVILWSCLSPAFPIPQSVCGRDLVAATEANPRVRVAMGQINNRVGDFSGNLNKLIEFTKKAAAENAEVLIFPEMAFSAYPARDLVDRPEFLEDSERALALFIKKIKDIPNCPETIIIGSATRNPKKTGRKAQNSSVVIYKNEVVYTAEKQLLPNYDVFDDMRNFESGKPKKPWNSPFGPVGCAVCEDSWQGGSVQGRRIYKNDPAKAMKGSSFVVNSSASPFYMGKVSEREKILGGFARKIKAPVIYVNQVGAHDEIVFDGASTVFNSEGAPLYTFKPFKEGLAVFDFQSESGNEGVHNISEWLHQDQESEDARWARPKIEYPSDSPMASVHQALILGIRDYFKKTGFKKAVLGLSGGIDSAVVATLLTEALGKENVLGILMPGPYSSEGSISDAKALAEKLGITTVMAPITNTTRDIMAGVDESTKLLAKKWDIPADEASEDNIQARLRMVNIMYFANKFGMLAMSTSNKSELSVGQTTIYGDMAGALAPIGDLFKTDIYALARYLNGISPRIPLATLEKAPSAELAPGQTDEGKFGPFAILDPVLRMHTVELLSEKEIIARGFDPEYVHRTIAIFNKQEYKRRVATIVLKMSPKAYGPGRRMPISSKSNHLGD